MLFNNFLNAIEKNFKIKYITGYTSDIAEQYFYRNMPEYIHKFYTLLDENNQPTNIIFCIDYCDRTSQPEKYRINGDKIVSNIHIVKINDLNIDNHLVFLNQMAKKHLDKTYKHIKIERSDQIKDIINQCTEYIASLTTLIKSAE